MRCTAITLAARPRYVFAKMAAVALLGFLILFACSNDAIAAPGDELWSHRIGPYSSMLDMSLATDTSGNVLAGGQFLGSINPGGGVLTSAGGWDIFVAKFNGAGAHLWSKRFGGNNTQLGGKIASDAAGNVLIAASSGDIDFGGGQLPDTSLSPIYLARLDPSGNHVWSEAFQTDGLIAAIAVDTTGNILIVGTFTGTVDFGGGVLTSAGGSDVFVAKFDPAGAHVWSARYGGASSQSPLMQAAVDGAGAVLIAGELQGTIDFGGGPLTSVDSSDLFVVKFDATGAHEWSKRFDADGQVNGIDTDGDANVILAGRVTSASIDFGGGPLTGNPSDINMYLAKFDAGGGHVWSQRYTSSGGSLNDVTAEDVTVTNSGNIVVTGFFRYLIDFGGGTLPFGTLPSDVFVVSFNADGDHQWSRSFGEADSDGDGCSNNEELGSSHVAGGQRNPSFTYDFYDVNGTQKVDAVDIALVRSKFNLTAGDPGYGTAFDRGPGAHPWAPGPPTGKIDAVDIALVRASFGDSCIPGDDQEGWAIAADSAGDVVVGGAYKDSIDFGGGALPVPDGLFIVKFDGTP